MVQVSLTVGKLDASLALLLTKDHHLIEFPTILLPDGITAGSIVRITCDRNLEEEQKEKEQFEQVQEEIYDLFGKNTPQAPVLRVLNVTQTSCVLEWDPLELGTSSIKSLTLYKNGERLGQIPNPLVNTNTKLSGLPIDTPYEFQLRLTTTAGVYTSNSVQLRTHKMTDLSGITVCVGEIEPNDAFTIEDIEKSLRKVGARPMQREVKVDTTHFICTKSVGPEWEKAEKMIIPVVRPEWIKACELERRIIGVRNFYVNAEDTSAWTQKNYWGKTEHQIPAPEEPTSGEISEQKTADNSKVEEPKTVVPTIEEPKIEQPIIEAPNIEAQAIEEPKIEAPTIEAPSIEEPKIEAPTIEELEIEEPTIVEKTGEPEAEEITIVEPTISEPVIEGQKREEPKNDDSIEEPCKTPTENVTENPVVQDPTVNDPTIEEPVYEEIPVTDPTIEEPIVDQTLSVASIDEPKTNTESVVGQVAEEPPVEDQIEETAVEAPAAKNSPIEESDIQEQPIEVQTVEPPVDLNRPDEDLSNQQIDLPKGLESNEAPAIHADGDLNSETEDHEDVVSPAQSSPTLVGLQANPKKGSKKKKKKGKK
ncbi:BA75_04647T0 [Komagataella pastoris]|uniref:Chitin biosynthesis protein CHS5 n=1 Tax=Komagataella pastoris TaxID=4922 RepID=A0A1B2JHT7_PICPA|nr:BA75_04647T0 [Komagataella pastoris]